MAEALKLFTDGIKNGQPGMVYCYDGNTEDAGNQYPEGYYHEWPGPCAACRAECGNKLVDLPEGIVLYSAPNNDGGGRLLTAPKNARLSGEPKGGLFPVALEVGGSTQILYIKLPLD